MLEHLSPELVMSGLRLLLEGYKVGRERFKDKKTPDRVEEIVTRVEKSPQQADTREIERNLTETLDPTDAAIVKSDLELLNLLMHPAPSLDAFDYWGKLSQLVAGLQAFANKNRLFELRGEKRHDLGEVIRLPRSGECILPERISPSVAIPYSRESVRDVTPLALLCKSTSDFPILLLVRARFNEYSPIGGPPGVVSDDCYFDIEAGQQRHWLKFDRGRRYTSHFLQSAEYRLEASDFMSIVSALRDDISEYAAEVQADEEKIAPLFTQIDQFVKQVRT